MKYIKKFENHNSYELFITSGDYPKPNVSYCVEENEVHYNPYVHDYSQDYLTFVAKADGTFKFGGTTTANTVSYSLDNGSTWTELANNTNSPTVTSGQKIMWKASLTPENYRGIGRFSSTAQFDVEGNIMSLLFGDDFKGKTSLSGKLYAFCTLFSNCGTLVSAEKMSLPATTLASSCYSCMFQRCTSLTTAPSLLATTLATQCYSCMFQGCTSLTTAPELPATTLVTNCYYYMFQGCTSLNSITCLATDISALRCTDSWVASVASSGTFTKAASMTSWASGTSGIPTNWTVETASVA